MENQEKYGRAKEAAAELWDQYSEYMGTDIDSIQDFAGQSIMQKQQFIKALNEYSDKLSQERSNGWIPVSEKLPITYETGAWDGTRSELVLCEFKYGQYRLAKLYDFGDGSTGWYDDMDFEIIIPPVRWKKIPL